MVAKLHNMDWTHDLERNPDVILQTQLPSYLCQSAKRLQPAGDSGGKALLAAQGCEQQTVLRRMCLIGSVRPAKLLDGLVRRPGQLQGEVHPPPLVLSPPAAVSPKVQSVRQLDSS